VIQSHKLAVSNLSDGSRFIVFITTGALMHCLFKIRSSCTLRDTDTVRIGLIEIF